jgi:hypothetical protein
MHPESFPDFWARLSSGLPRLQIQQKLIGLHLLVNLFFETFKQFNVNVF